MVRDREVVRERERVREREVERKRRWWRVWSGVVRETESDRDRC